MSLRALKLIKKNIHRFESITNTFRLQARRRFNRALYMARNIRAGGNGNGNDNGNGNAPSTPTKPMGQYAGSECPVCFDPFEPNQYHVFECGHQICRSCWNNPGYPFRKCPICRLARVPPPRPTKPPSKDGNHPPGDYAKKLSF